MLDGFKLTAAASLRFLSWITAGYVHSPGMALRREFQVHQVLKHLSVVFTLSGFKVQLSQPRGEASKNDYNSFCFFLSQKVG